MRVRRGARPRATSHIARRLYRKSFPRPTGSSASLNCRIAAGAARRPHFASEGRG